MSELPQGWIDTTIEEISEYVQRGKSPKYVEKSELPVINQKCIRWSGVDTRYLKFIHPDQWDSWASERFLCEGDILWNSTGTGTIGRAALYKNLEDYKRVVADSHVTIVRANQACNKSFLHYFIRSPFVQSKIEDMQSGSTNQVELSRGQVLNTVIPLAPLNEQKRIADKLDRLLAKVDACRERCDRIPLILKRFRQSVLAAATSGELTEDWRESNDHNPRTSWKSLLIGDLMIGKPRNGYSPKAVEFETKTKSLTLTATTSGRFNPKHFKYINETIPQDSHLWLEPEDILIQRANTLEYVGVSAIYDGPSKGFMYPDLMMKCRANSKVITKFLYYLLSSDDVRSYFRDNATGTAGNMPKINQQTVISAPALVPPIEEQQEIVRRAKKLFAFADRLESRYQTARAKCDQLTPALLEKAFQGELVPQDPNDEPASVLLKRIKSLRTNAEANQTKPQRRKTASEKPYRM